MSVDLRPLTAAVPEACADAIRGAGTVLVVSHENPDADTLGAALAVCMLVEHGGRSATALCADPIPQMYGFLPGVERFSTDPEPGRGYDLIVTVDCADLDRIGAVRSRHRELFDAVPVLAIDHHVSNAGVGPRDWIDPGSAATCEMVALLAVLLGVPLTTGEGALAGALVAGIVMDTATFAHPNTTPRTLVVTAALLEAGAGLSEASRRMYRTKPDAQLRLFGRVLARLETSASGRVVWSTLEEGDVEGVGALPEHSEGIIDLIAQSERGEVMILFKQKGPETRISVRTKPGGVDATVLCGRWGGGGHARAAGATVNRPFGAAVPEVVAAAEALAATVVP